MMIKGYYIEKVKEFEGTSFRVWNNDNIFIAMITIKYEKDDPDPYIIIRIFDIDSVDEINTRHIYDFIDSLPFIKNKCTNSGFRLHLHFYDFDKHGDITKHLVITKRKRTLTISKSFIYCYLRDEQNPEIKKYMLRIDTDLISELMYSNKKFDIKKHYSYINLVEFWHGVIKREYHFDKDNNDNIIPIVDRSYGYYKAITKNSNDTLLCRVEVAPSFIGTGYILKDYCISDPKLKNLQYMTTKSNLWVNVNGYRIYKFNGLNKIYVNINDFFNTIKAGIEKYGI